MIVLSAQPLRYRPFGLFRFGLAMLVLLQHGLLLLPLAKRNIFYNLELGAVAVTTFFSLSGFIVAEALGSFYARRPLAFLANRVLRVVPPYVVALALTILVQSWLFTLGRLMPLDAPVLGSPWQPRIVLSALCEIVPGLPSWRISGQDFSFIPFAWTLRIEFAFYFGAFATCWLMLKAGPLGLIFRRGIPIAAIAAGYLLFFVFLIRHGQGPRQILCIPFFAFGLGVFFYRIRPGSLPALHLVALAILVPVAFTFWGQRGHPILAVQLALLACLYLVLFVLSGITGTSPIFRHWDRAFGDLSYPLYIGHGIVLVILSSFSENRSWALYWAGVAASLALAKLLHMTVEIPLRRIRDRLRGAKV